MNAASLALSLLALDPTGLKGLALRARSGPERDAFLERLDMLPGPVVRLHPSMDEDALFGGVDIVGSLAAGRSQWREGALARAGTVVFASAERCSANLAGRLAALIDEGTAPVLILLDEGAEPAEAAPPALVERLAFQTGFGEATIAQGESQEVTAETAARVLAGLAARFGIASLRAPLFALRAARAIAQIGARDRLTSGDLEIGAALVYPHRAMRMPQEELEAPNDDTPPEPRQGGGEEFPEEMMIEAVQTRIDPDWLAGLAGRAARAAGSGAGARRKGNRRGRPLAARQGRPDGRNRLDLVATLRAAAPWQKLRASPGRLSIRMGDLRVRRFEDRSDRLLIFAVDASGSAALARLGEAKGAAESLLARAYASRDHVALVSFRDRTAEVILPPTRSLVRAKRALSGLPGGGATPLAAGLEAAADLAGRATAQGFAPVIILMTDGRANISHDGRADRAQAGADATRVASHLRLSGTASLVLDTAMRPQPALADLARALGARYVALPRAAPGDFAQALVP